MLELCIKPQIVLCLKYKTEEFYPSVSPNIDKALKIKLKCNLESDGI